MYLKSYATFSAHFLLAILVFAFAGNAQTTRSPLKSPTPAETNSNAIVSGIPRVNRSSFSGQAGNRPEPGAPPAATGLAGLRTLSITELEKLLKKTLNSNVRDAILFNNLGIAFYERKMFDKAANALTNAVAIAEHPDFLTNLSIIYDAAGRVSEAVSTVKRAVAADPSDVRARTQLCELMIVSKQHPAAVNCYQELDKMAPLDELDKSNYSVALSRAGKYDEAIAVLEPLISGSYPTVLMFNTYGNALYMKKRYKKAAKAFKRAVEIAPERVRLRYNLAMASLAIGDRANAISQYNHIKTKDEKLARQLFSNIYSDKILAIDGPGSTVRP